MSYPVPSSNGNQLPDRVYLNPLPLPVHPPLQSIAYDLPGIRERLLALAEPVWAVSPDGKAAGFAHPARPEDSREAAPDAYRLIAAAPPMPIQSLGSAAFRAEYGTAFAYYAGSMANGISSEAMVVALGKAGLMGSFGAAGLVPARIEEAIRLIQQALPDGPYAFNLINNPNEPALEQRAAELYVKHGVTVIEASAYLGVTGSLVYYRASGLSQKPDGEIRIGNRIIAKVSRKEVARRFMEPAPLDLLNRLLAEGKISEQQARLAQRVPMADDITVEADSGGHTDNRPLVCILPAMLALRDEVQEAYSFSRRIRVGAAGGISTPASALAAFSMGADYIVTGSANQACVESGASEHTRRLLAQAEMADVMMAPAADMFEMGVKVQLLKRGTLFPLRAQKLYEIYSRYPSVEEIPADERSKLERQVFKRSLEEIWQDTIRFFSERDPGQIERATRDPRQKMALIFRWYLGLSSRWSVSGEKGREMDYQIWCGPAMGAFNEWVRPTYLAEPANRQVVDVALHILTGCAYLSRVYTLKAQGVHFPPQLEQYQPLHPLAPTG